MANGQANGQWYPPEWPDRIRALAAGTLTPVTPKRAATVMLLKDTGSGTESTGAGAGPAVHMLRRRTSMAFAVSPGVPALERVCLVIAHPLSQGP